MDTIFIDVSSQLSQEVSTAVPCLISSQGEDGTNVAPHVLRVCVCVRVLHIVTLSKLIRNMLKCSKGSDSI